MRNTEPMELNFDVCMPSELGAGLRGFTDTVNIKVASGDPGGEAGEFESYMRNCIAEWFDGATVEVVKKS